MSDVTTERALAYVLLDLHAEGAVNLAQWPTGATFVMDEIAGEDAAQKHAAWSAVADGSRDTDDEPWAGGEDGPDLLAYLCDDLINLHRENADAPEVFSLNRCPEALAFVHEYTDRNLSGSGWADDAPMLSPGARVEYAGDEADQYHLPSMVGACGTVTSFDMGDEEVNGSAEVKWDEPQRYLDAVADAFGPDYDPEGDSGLQNPLLLRRIVE